MLFKIFCLFERNHVTFCSLLCGLTGAQGCWAILMHHLNKQVHPVLEQERESAVGAQKHAEAGPESTKT